MPSAATVPSNSPAGWTLSRAARWPSTRTATLLASGRQARTRTRPPSGWAPSTRWGSWCSPRTRRSISSCRGIRIALRSVLPPFVGILQGSLPVPEQPLHAAERDGKPRWPMSGLVHPLVNRLVQLVGAQQQVGLVGEPAAALRALHVGVQEGAAVRLDPALCQPREPGQLLPARAGGVRVLAEHQRLVRGVVEGA